MGGAASGRARLRVVLLLLLACLLLLRTHAQSQPTANKTQHTTHRSPTIRAASSRSRDQEALSCTPIHRLAVMAIQAPMGDAYRRRRAAAAPAAALALLRLPLLLLLLATAANAAPDAFADAASSAAVTAPPPSPPSPPPLPAFPAATYDPARIVDAFIR